MDTKIARDTQDTLSPFPGPTALACEDGRVFEIGSIRYLGSPPVEVITLLPRSTSIDWSQTDSHL